MLLFFGVNKGEPCPTMLRRRLGSAAGNALARQSPGFEMKRDRWSEADIDALPGEETDAFDRKAGALFDDRNAFLDTLAKAVSAFANSGGGSLILGSRDDGSPDGLPATIGSTSMRDWIEQKLPNLVAYPINDFCVHTVQRSNNSRIPPDRVVVVIDIGDSSLAPHQDSRSKYYYVRQGGRSVPASHFYLELLRQRLTNPALSFKLTSVKPAQFAKHGDYLYAELILSFEIENVGRAAAYKWRLTARAVSHDTLPEGSLKQRRPSFDRGCYPVRMPNTDGAVPLDTTILPGCIYVERQRMGIGFCPAARTEESLRAEIETCLGELKVQFTLATENSPGEPIDIEFRSFFDAAAIAASAASKLPEFFKSA